MRGSLNRPKTKAAQQNIEISQAKKAKESLILSESWPPSNDGYQQGDTNMEAIFLTNVPRDGLDKAKRSKLKPIRGQLNTKQSQTKLNVRAQEDNTIIDDETHPNMPSLDKTKSNSSKGEFERLKLKPMRGSLKTSENEVKLLENGGQTKPNMDSMTLPDMIRFLQTEEALLTQLQRKMADELSRLQVEEHIFLHTLKILSQKHASTNKVNEDEQEISNGDQDLINALNEALMENGESVPSKQNKCEDEGEETSEQ